MTIDIFEALLYILVGWSIIAVGFLIAVLFRANRILARVEKIAEIGEHMRNAVIAFESIPAMILKKIADRFFDKK